MNSATKLEHRASSSRSKHEGEPSIGLCDRLSRTRDNSQRQLPTDHDYAVPTREYQTDQSSLKPAQAAARSVLEKQKQRQKQTHRIAELTRSLHISPMRSSTVCKKHPEFGRMVG
jgi:Mg-chelatase subunit ChlI